MYVPPCLLFENFHWHEDRLYSTYSKNIHFTDQKLEFASEIFLHIFSQYNVHKKSYTVFPITLAMFVEMSNLDKLTARTTMVSHLAVGVVEIIVEEWLGGESITLKLETQPR